MVEVALLATWERTMVDQPIRHTSLASSATDWITSRIIEGEIKPGERITEIALAEQMGISRSPVREALRSLSREGFITLEPRRGARVGELDRRHAEDLYACRLLIEPECTALAVTAMDDERATALAATFDRMAVAVRGHDTAEYVTTLKDYNLMLLDACPNRVLFGFAETSWRSSLRYWDLLIRGSANYMTQSLRRNRAVQNAVKRRDAEEARAQSAAVLETGRAQLLRTLDKLRPTS